MNEEEEKNRGFKVADRRRFSAEGDPKQESEEAKPAAPQDSVSAGHGHRDRHEGPHSGSGGNTPGAILNAEGSATAVHSAGAGEHHRHEHHEHLGPSAGDQAQASAEYQRAASGQASDLGPQDLTFASFVVGLSTEALALMGEMPHPATGERLNDLAGAQQLVDIIGILQEKTRNNLTHDEETLLEAILFELRMKYVEKARGTQR